MDIAMIGLGRMGMNMARRLMRGGHRVVAYNRSPEKTDRLVAEGAVGAYSLREVVQKLPVPRIAWIMLPAGSAVEEQVLRLRDLLSPGDIVVDGGNTDYKDDLRRAEALKKKGVHFLDVGVSGGVWGLEKGFCLMIGGDETAFRTIEPLLETLAPPEGYLYCGPIGAGHFVKMVHNGIEYGMMEAYGEGFHILEESPYGKTLDYSRLARLWNRGSVVRSWLLELAESFFARDGKLERIRGYVEDSGEGRWTVRQAIELGVPAPVITLSLMERFRSRNEDRFADRVIAALRREFGGHAVRPREGDD
ncbi:MAG: decarboxylating 6-phosphogluconate dehydrogenase [Deltaproteobacteria bacterium]|nr:decarboxylating 6-phosphogluconate dehydrogenase [Deltaproteobacteria bacterium]